MGARTSSRKEAAEAARRLLQSKVELVANLAEYGARVDEAEAAVEAAGVARDTARTEYGEQYKAALAAGWTDAELAEVGCGPERGDAALARAKTRRKRASKRTREDAPGTPGAPPTDPAVSDSHGLQPAAS